MQELWQLYNTLAEPIPSQGASRDEVFGQGLLHGAAHVLIWRKHQNGKEILLQQRSADKIAFPNMLDISAGGHIDLGESPEAAAVRETCEEIGLDTTSTQLKPVGRFHMNIEVSPGFTENEFRWVYLLELTSNSNFRLQEEEVASVRWIPFEQFKKAVLPNNGQYVPHGEDYFRALLAAMQS